MSIGQVGEKRWMTLTSLKLKFEKGSLKFDGAEESELTTTLESPEAATSGT